MLPTDLRLQCWMSVRLLNLKCRSKLAIPSMTLTCCKNLNFCAQNVAKVQKILQIVLHFWIFLQNLSFLKTFLLKNKLFSNEKLEVRSAEIGKVGRPTNLYLKNHEIGDQIADFFDGIVGHRYADLFILYPIQYNCSCVHSLHPLNTSSGTSYLWFTFYKNQ